MSIIKKIGKVDTTLNVNALNIDVIKNLIEAIEKHYEDMPKELRDIMVNLYEAGADDFGVDDYELYIRTNRLKREDIEISHKKVIKANKHLKKVYYIDGTSEHLNNFTIKHEDTLIYGW